MEAFAIYLIKATACLTIFAVFFRLLLLRETFFRFTRIVLLAGMLICSLLPLIKISTEQPNIVQQFTIRLEETVETMQTQPQIAVPTAEAAHELTEAPDETPALINSADKFTINWWSIITTVYLTGVGLMLLRLVISLVRLRQLLRSNTVITDNGYRLVITPDEVMPFSFFRYIVLSEKDYRDNPEAIILHEQMHMRKLHNIDIILSEIVLTLHWFNPMVWMLSRDLREIHEYEADSAVLAEGIAPQQYQLLLVKKAVGEKRFAAVVNNFNQSKIKNRITMMLKTQSTPWAQFKALFIVPFAALALLAFSGIDQVVPENSKDTVIDEATRQQAMDYLLYMQGENPKGVGYIYIDTNDQIYVMHKADESYATFSVLDANDDESLTKVFHTVYDQALKQRNPVLTFVFGAEKELQMKTVTHVREQLRKSYAQWSSSLSKDDRIEVVKSKMLLSVKFTLLDDVHVSTADKIRKNPLYYWEEVQRISESWKMEPKDLHDKINVTKNERNIIITLINSVNDIMIQGVGVEPLWRKSQENIIDNDFIDRMADEIVTAMDKNPVTPIFFILQNDTQSSPHFVHHYLTHALPLAYDNAISHQADRLSESVVNMKTRYPFLLFYTYAMAFSKNSYSPSSEEQLFRKEIKENNRFYHAWSHYEDGKTPDAMTGFVSKPVGKTPQYEYTNTNNKGATIVTLGSGITESLLPSVLDHIHDKVTNRTLYLFSHYK